MSQAAAKVCSDCGTPMEVGMLVLSYTTFNAPVEWVAGEAGPSGFWTNGIPNGPRHQVVTYRCPACGLLKSYAAPDA